MSAAAHRESGHRIEICGADGSLILDNPGRDYMRGFPPLFARPPNAWDPLKVSTSDEDSWQDGRALPASRLAKRVANWALGEPCGPSFSTGRCVQTLLEAARDSNKTGNCIDTSANKLG
jgi:predicted dehydrogenase